MEKLVLLTRFPDYWLFVYPVPFQLLSQVIYLKYCFNLHFISLSTECQAKLLARKCHNLFVSLLCLAEETRVYFGFIAPTLMQNAHDIFFAGKSNNYISHCNHGVFDVNR